jgi:hypothetical protein
MQEVNIRQFIQQLRDDSGRKEIAPNGGRF